MLTAPTSYGDPANTVDMPTTLVFDKGSGLLLGMRNPLNPTSVIPLGGSGAGTVTEVNGVSPDGTGLVTLQPSDIGAAAASDLTTVASTASAANTAAANAVTSASNANATASAAQATANSANALAQALQTETNNLALKTAWFSAGDWNASTNTPALVSSSGTEGAVYKVSVAGTTNLDGIAAWSAGDFAVVVSGKYYKVGANGAGLVPVQKADGSTDLVSGATVILNTFGNLARVTPVPDLTLSTSLQQLQYPTVRIYATLLSGDPTNISIVDQAGNDFGTFDLTTVGVTKMSDQYITVITGQGFTPGKLKYVVNNTTGSRTLAVVASSAVAVQNTNTQNLVNMGGSLSYGMASDPNGYYGLSFVTQAMQQLGWRVDLQADLAGYNATSNDLLNTQLPALQALLPAPGWVLLTIPTQDFIAALATPDVVIGRLKQVIGAIVATGAKLIVVTGLPGTMSAASATNLAIVNSWATQFCNTVPNCHLVDAASALVDPANGQTASSYVGSDTNTVSLNGAILMGKLVFDVIDPVMKRRGLSSASVDNKVQIVRNPRMVATTGGGNSSGTNGWTAQTGTSGVGPDNYTLSRTGTASAVATYVARNSATYSPPGAGNVLSLTLTGGSSGDTVVLAPAQDTIINWSSGGSVTKGQRMRASFGSTACGVVHFLCTVAGTLATGSDPTSSGAYTSTAIGGTFTDGSVTFMVVPSIDGDQGLKPWVASGTYQVNMRIKPTTPNGCHYKVTAATGALASTSDPTATWSTTVGATFSDGGVSLQVINAYDNGDSVYALIEAYGAFSGSTAGAIQLVLSQYTYTYGYLKGSSGNLFSSGVVQPTMWKNGVIKTRPVQLDSSIGRFASTATFMMGAAAAGNIEVVRFEIRKVGT